MQTFDQRFTALNLDNSLISNYSMFEHEKFVEERRNKDAILLILFIKFPYH